MRYEICYVVADCHVGRVAEIHADGRRICAVPEDADRHLLERLVEDANSANDED